MTVGVRDPSPWSTAPPDLSGPGLAGQGWSPPTLWSRHRRLRVALVGLLVVGGVLLALARSVNGTLLSTDTGPSSFPGEQVHSGVAQGDEIRVAFAPGAPYEFAFTVTNYSRWPVRVLDFPSFGDLLRLRAVDLDWTPLAGENWRPFRPFTLGADDSVLVRVRAEFARCDRSPTGGSATVGQVPVRYRALWATRTHSLALPAAIDVPAPPRGGCPVS